MTIKKVIKTEAELEALLSRLVKNSLKEARLIEQDDAGLFADDDEKNKKGDTAKQTDEKETETAVKEPVKQFQRDPIPASTSVTIDMVSQKLNTLRSGKSLKDASTRQEMLKYFEGLSNEERLALWTFLDGLSQILVNAVPGDDATDPSDASSEIKIEPSEKKEKKERVENDSSSAGTEDTATPIKVVRRGSAPVQQH